MAGLPAASVDAVVCDPPYGLSFMGKDWDHGVPGVAFWSAALRVAKPGAHLLAFGGTRTFHRLAVAIEDAGWEIRDTVMWVYGSGFPKSHDVGKGIDKAAGAERELVGSRTYADGRCRDEEPSGVSRHKGKSGSLNGVMSPSVGITAPATDAARQWDGWGTALKPAWEPIIVARKPLEGTVAANVLAHGVGALNIDGCRVGSETISTHSRGTNGAFPKRPGETSAEESGRVQDQREGLDHSERQGRWPANLIHDGSDEVLAGFPQTTSGSGHVRHAGNVSNGGSGYKSKAGTDAYWQGDTGSAARFFYCAKASKADRDEGCEALEERSTAFNDIGFDETKRNRQPRENKSRNHHPTVKPTALMRYLCKLVTPPAGTVLDPFMGSGSTGKAARMDGFGFIGIEQDADYIAIARARIAHAVQSPAQQPLHI
jgi:site-specific DNA-methyltransferase (adenine-specific)